MEWSKELICQLIEDYKQHQVLWDTSSRQFKNKQKRSNAWDSIADHLQISKYEAEKKMKILIGQFQREFKKVLRRNLNLDGQCQYHSKWFAFQSMLFLKDKTKLQTETEDSSNEGNKETDSETRETQSSEEVTSNKELLSPKEIRNSNSDPDPHTQNPVKNRDTLLEKACRIIKNANEERIERDDYFVYGEHVGRKIKRLRTEYARSTVQHLINNILYDADLGKYDNPSSTRTRFNEEDRSSTTIVPESIKCEML